MKRRAVVWAGLAVGLGLLAWFCARPAACPHTAIPNDVLAVQAEAAQPGRYVCLTFDDGPSKHTDAIAAALAEYNAPATFFVTAQPANLPYYDRLPALLAAGHQIAMHSASHDYAAIYQSPEAFWLDIKALRQALEPYVPLDELYWLRFPAAAPTRSATATAGGRSCSVSLPKPKKKATAGSTGTSAARTPPPPARTPRRSHATSPKAPPGGDVCIVLLHDTAATAATVRALPDILAWFDAEGYRFCTVEEMFSMTDGGG